MNRLFNLSMVALPFILGWLSLDMQGQQASTNLALNRPVFSSGANFGSFRPASLTDGSPDTFTSPAAGSGTLGFYYQVDLGRLYHFDRIVLRNRGDGCCPERLSRFKVEVYGAGGDTVGPLLWSAKLRSDGTHSGAAGTDVITAAMNTNSVFAGRFVRVVNDSGMGYSPQLAEIEVYGSFAPEIRSFTAEKDNLAAGESTLLKWDVLYATEVLIEGIAGPIPASGEIKVTPSRTTFYTLKAANAATSVSSTLGVGVHETLRPPVLNEFVANNASSFEDEDGDPSDWIEILNPNAFSLSLEGLGLSDQPDLSAVWTFPALRLPPRGFVVVFASGKNRREVSNPLHTSFRLDAAGDFLALVDRDGKTRLQTFPDDHPVQKTFPGLGRNVAFGIGSSGAKGFLKPPTPGQPNGPAFAGVVADTKFSHDRGFYESPFMVRITSATPDAVIRYTTNRSRPTATTGLVYTGPIPISRTTILRAIAFKDGWAPTDVDTHTYLFPSNVIASPLLRTSVTTHPAHRPRMKDALASVPSISLVASGTIRDEVQVLTSFEWLDPRGPSGRQADCGVQLFGGAFTDFAKKSFRLYFKSEFGPPRLELPVFDGYGRDWAPASTFDQLELRSGSHDMEMRGFYMSNLFADDTQLALGQLAPHGRFVHLYLNGDYGGVYHLRERWGASMHREYFGGTEAEYESINGNWNVGGWAEPGTPYDGDGTTWALAKSLRQQYDRVRAYVDVPNYIDYMLTWIWGRCEDEYRCVGPIMPGHGFKFYINDADGFFQSPAHPWYGEPSQRTLFGAQGRQPGDGPGNLFSSLYRSGGSDYRTLLADRIHRAFFANGPLTSEQTVARLLERCRELELPFLGEAARWNYRTPEKWTSIRDDVVTNWVPTRAAEVMRQLRAAGFYPSIEAPVLHRQGGLVPAGFEVSFLGPPSATIFYTLDGSDPRLPGGTVSPGAKRVELGGRSEVLIPAGANWKWFTDGAGLGSSDMVAGKPSWSEANWKHPDYSDTAWKTGAAQLGYGEGDEATTIPFGNNANDKWTTSYFRLDFTMASLTGLLGFEARLKADDGAIVYLNGVEVARVSMNPGPVLGNTKAQAAADDGQGFATLSVSALAARAGRNLLAVELHQSTTNTSDASFDLELKAAYAGAAAGESPVLRANTLLRARALSGSQWSALNEAYFQTRTEALLPGEIALTEIHYHPRGIPSAEFIELANVSSHAVNLRGCRFSDGIEFAFPQERDTVLASGHRLVLTKDLFEFRRRYGLDVAVGGIYRGSLNNAGETIAIVLPSGATLSQVTYQSQAPWPMPPEEGGRSLVWSRPEMGSNHPQAWTLGSELHGGPGRTDRVGFVGDPRRDQDRDGLSALFEYALGTRDDDPASGPSAWSYGFGSAGEFFVRFQRNSGAFDAVLRVEKSMDLETWSWASRLGTEETRVPGLVVERWGLPGPMERSAFLRIRVVVE